MRAALAGLSALSEAKSILFLCGMNAIRSPMAESIAKSLLPQSHYVASAGVHKGESDPFVEVVLSETGRHAPDRTPHTLPRASVGTRVPDASLRVRSYFGAHR